MTLHDEARAYAMEINARDFGMELQISFSKPQLTKVVKDRFVIYGNEMSKRLSLEANSGSFHLIKCEQYEYVVNYPVGGEDLLESSICIPSG